MAKITISKKKKTLSKKSASKKKRLITKVSGKKTVKTKAKKRLKKIIKRTTRKTNKNRIKSNAKKTTKKITKKTKKKVTKRTSARRKTSLHPVLIKIRDRLIQNRAELYKILQLSREVERNPSELNFSNEIDLAASLEGREMAFTLSSRDRNELKLIEQALFKISNGVYGTCESCSKNITMKRLEIMPLTPFCIQCQSTMEHP